MTLLDQISLALCAWKENRGGGAIGMQSVANVVMNRMAKSGHSAYAEIYKPLQFSSMSYQHDPQLLIQPADGDAMWAVAQGLAQRAHDGVLPDVTGGATFYYALTIAAPYWAASMTQTVIIEGQQFLK